MVLIVPSETTAANTAARTIKTIKSKKPSALFQTKASHAGCPILDGAHTALNASTTPVVIEKRLAIKIL